MMMMKAVAWFFLWPAASSVFTTTEAARVPEKAADNVFPERDLQFMDLQQTDQGLSGETILLLTEGVGTEIVNGQSFDLITFVLDNVTEGQRVACEMTGDGNVNMAGRYGAAPTNLAYDCIGYIAGSSDEGCGLYAAPNQTSVYVTAYAFSNFNSITVMCKYVDAVVLENGVSLTGVESDLPGSTLFYTFDTQIKAGENVSCTLEGDNGNANLYLRYDSDPEIFARDTVGYDCQSRGVSSTEECLLEAPGKKSALHIAVDTMSAFDNATITCGSPAGYVTGSSGDADGSGWLRCFSGITTVQVKHKGEVAMEHLQVGDYVLAANGKYERVYSFGHYHKTMPTEYLQLHTATNNIKKAPLEITEDHLLFVQGRQAADPIRAGNVKVGDVLLMGGGADGDASRVTKITKIQRTGAFAPLTPSGTIVVNGQLASSYISIAEAAPVIVQSFFGRVISEHQLFHAWLSPYRMVCIHLSNNLCGTAVADDGILTWLHAGLALAEFSEGQHVVLQVVGVATVFIIGMTCSLWEWILFGSSWKGLLMGAAIAKLVWSSYRNMSISKKLN